MTDNYSQPSNRVEEETDSWVYSYTTDRASNELKDGDACKIVRVIRASKYSDSLLPEGVNISGLEHRVLATARNTLEVEAQSGSIAFRICEKGATGQETCLTLSLKDAWVVLGLLTQAIKDVTTSKTVVVQNAK